MLSKPATKVCRVGVVDDHELLLDGLTTYMRGNAADIDVVISATGWLELIRSANFAPDVIVMDLQLPEQISIESRVRTCLAAGAVVVVMSALETPEIRERSLAAGAAAFVSKSSSAEAVVEAVRAVWGTTHEPRIFDEAELATLRLYTAGLSPIDIGLQLGMTFETVKNHLARIRSRYEADGRPAASKQDLIRRVAEDGLVS